MEEEPNVVLALRATVQAQSMAAPAPAAPRATTPKSDSPPPPPAPPPPAAATASFRITATPAPVGPGVRQRFYVELKPGETTIVSWKKLLRDADKKERAVEAEAAAAGGASTTPVGAHPSLEGRIAPVPAVPVQDQPPPLQQQQQQQLPVDTEPPAPHNRFSAVIEKIERLYMGNDSSEDEQPLDDVPDDDQYDTEDSFIDDAELDEYFQVDKSATKHHGFFVNKGKLERIEPAPSSDQPPQKRRKKEAVESVQKDGGRRPSKVLDKGIARIKAAARVAPLAGKMTNPTEHHGLQHNQDAKIVKSKSISSTGSMARRRLEPLQASEYSTPTKTVTQDAAPTASAKDFERQKTAITSRDPATRPKAAGEIVDARQEPARHKGLSTKEGNNADPSFRNRGKQRNGNVELPDLNYPGTGMVYPTQSPGGEVQVKEATKPKGTMLERAIRELQKVAVLYQPPHPDNKEKDAALGTKKRLPVEVKQKLAKVARLANSQGKINSEVFFGHLMGILGHLIQPNALKRHLKEMVAIGLTAKQENANRFQQIKKEVAEMVKTQMVEQQAGSSDDFQDPPVGQRTSFSMNEALEDKLYLLYELHVEGMEEDKGPQSRKLYVELSELWPVGYMDRLAIKDAIARAKTRKIALYKKNKALQEEKLKRRRLSSSSGMDDSGRLSSQIRSVPDRISNATNDSGDMHAMKHQERLRASGSSASMASDQLGKATTPMKKVKWKAEDDLGTPAPSHSTKLSSLSRDKDKPSRPSETYSLKLSETYPPKLSLNQSPSPGPQPPS